MLNCKRKEAGFRMMVTVNKAMPCARKLGKNCPHGEITINKDAIATLMTTERVIVSFASLT